MAQSYLIAALYGSYATTGVTKQLLGAFALGSGEFKPNGSVIRIVAFGDAAATNNAKSFSIEVAGRTVAYMLSGANNRAMVLEAMLCRASPTSITAYGQGVCGSQAMTLSTTIMWSLSSALSFGAFSTTAVASGGFVMRAMMIELMQRG